jgi:hypothetical protein
MPERIKQRDTLSTFPLSAIDEQVNELGVNVASPADLTGCSLQWIGRMSGAKTTRFNRALTEAEKIDLAHGEIDYNPQRDEVGLVGTLQLELEVTDATGDVRTYPTYGYFEVEIVDDIDDAPTA